MTDQELEQIEKAAEAAFPKDLERLYQRVYRVHYEERAMPLLSRETAEILGVLREMTWARESVPKLVAEVSRLKTIIAESPGCGMARLAQHNHEIAEQRKAQLQTAREALQAVVNGGDKDAYWATDWHQTYEKARAALAKLKGEG